jgi:hypothetical protein
MDTDKQVLLSKSNLLFPIRAIRAIRGKVFANRSDADRLQGAKNFARRVAEGAEKGKGLKLSILSAFSASLRE